MPTGVYERTPEERAKHSAATKALGWVGDKHPSWKGADISYVGIHQRAGRVLPRVCAKCGETEGRLECALNHADAPEGNLRESPFRGSIRIHSISTDDYIRLCPPCHRNFDRKGEE